MSKSTSVVLGDELAEFIDRQIAKGRYGSSSEMVRAGLRLLEENETRLETLRAALAAGEASGPATDFDFDAFVARKRAGK
jgi:antitoxin ParD1/3/4